LRRERSVRAYAHFCIDDLLWFTNWNTKNASLKKEFKYLINKVFNYAHFVFISKQFFAKTCVKPPPRCVQPAYKTSEQVDNLKCKTKTTD